jgi:hypothetical protein
MNKRDYPTLHLHTNDSLLPQAVPLLSFVCKCSVGQSLLFIYIHILYYYKPFLYFHLCLMLGSLSCSFTSIFFTLHLHTNESRGTACGNKEYGCKWTRETIQHYTYTQMKVKDQLLVLVHLHQYSFLTTSCSFSLVCVQV